MVTYDAVLVFWFTFVHVEKPKSSRQVVFSLFLKVDNKSCHPQKENLFKHYPE